MFKFSYFNRIVDLWNNVHLTIRKNKSYDIFKNITKFYIKKFYSNVNIFLNLYCIFIVIHSDMIIYYILIVSFHYIGVC